MAYYSFDVLLSRSFFQLVGDLTELNEKIYSDLAESESRDLLVAPESEASEASVDSDACAAEDIELGDLEMVATLGVGGFGRVELVKVSASSELGFSSPLLLVPGPAGPGVRTQMFVQAARGGDDAAGETSDLRASKDND